VAEVVADVVEEEAPVDSKLIVIKPPILVPELASRLGLKPFNIMADLIKLGVFPAPNQPLEHFVSIRVFRGRYHQLQPSITSGKRMDPSLC
jgi:translation initiation factor IF-2